jgi:2-phospho-L-lactate guanylyltransferase (CobY/MobA/RfbA family)
MARRDQQIDSDCPRHPTRSQKPVCRFAEIIRRHQPWRDRRHRETARPEANRDGRNLIPADIPLIAEWELAEIFAKAQDEGSVLVQAADGRGTNAAFRRPTDLFALRFGNDSFKPHLAAAQSTGKNCIVLSLPGTALDVDRPDDLQQLVLADGDGHAQRLARQWDLSGYPMDANE